MFGTLNYTIMACDAPLSIRYNPPRPDGKGGLIYYFPGDCGKCLNCLKKRKAAWSFRLMEEQRKAFSAYFVTLTYDEKHVPHTDEGLTINKNDHKEFINELKAKETPKALGKRKYISIEESDRKKRMVRETGKLKYYGVYEYGDREGRPHAHYILFNVRDCNNINLAWAGKGIVDIDSDVNVNNIDYVLKYMIKDHSNIDYENKQKEVSFMSKGLGASAATSEFTSYIRKADNTQVCTPRGTKIAIPRYYRKKYLTEEERIKKAQKIAVIVRGNEEKTRRKLSLMGYDIGKVELKEKQARHQALMSRAKRN